MFFKVGILYGNCERNDLWDRDQEIEIKMCLSGGLELQVSVLSSGAE